MRVARHSFRKSLPHPQAHAKQPVAAFRLHFVTPYSVQASVPHLTTATYSRQSLASSPAAVKRGSALAAGKVDIPARIGLVHGRKGFVGGDNRIVELDVEGSSAAGLYSQRNHMENCATLHPTSVPLNVGAVEPRDIYPGIVSIFVYSYYRL